MPPIKSFPCLLSAGAAVLLCAAAAGAQAPDARVLPRGMLEVRVLGQYTQFGDRFGSGGLEPLGSGFDAIIASPAGALAGQAADSASARLAGFYLRTQPLTGGDTPLDLQPGTPRSRLSGDFRDAPATVALGLTSRLTLEATVSLHRRGTVVRGIDMVGGTLGVNPSPERNAALLAQVDSLYAATSGRFLPLRGTPAGDELQRRVLQIAGDTLTLPTLATPLLGFLNDPGREGLDTATAALLRTGSGRTDYYLGDTYLGARFQFARSTEPWAAPPTDSTFRPGFRAVVAGRVRIPTGSRSATVFALQFPPEGGRWGVAGEVAADWFASRRWWITAAGDFEAVMSADVHRLAFSEALPFPDSTARRTLRQAGGARFGATFTPRYRLTREIAFAAQYAARFVGSTSLNGGEEAVLLGPIERLDAQSAHVVGLGMSYSTLAAYRAGESPFPAEMSLLLRRVVAGSGFAPRAGSVELIGRLYAPVFGRARRAAADSAPPAPPPPAEVAPTPAPAVVVPPRPVIPDPEAPPLVGPVGPQPSVSPRLP